MDWNIETVDNVCVVNCNGEFIEDYREGFRAKIENLIDAGNKDMIFDLTSLDYIDSMGLVSLVECLKKARQKNGDIKLSNMKTGVKLIIEIAGLNKLFEMHENNELALKSFSTKGISVV